MYWRSNLWNTLATGCGNEHDSCFIVFCAFPEGISACLTFGRHWMFEDCVCVWTGVGPTDVFSTWLWWGWREETSSSLDWRQTAAPSVLSLHLSGLLRFASFSTPPVPSSLSPLLHGQPGHQTCVSWSFTLAKSEGGATVKSQCFPALTNDKDGRMDPRAQLEERDFHEGDKKDPQCFSLASEL